MPPGPAQPESNLAARKPRHLSGAAALSRQEGYSDLAEKGMSPYISPRGRGATVRLAAMPMPSPANSAGSGGSYRSSRCRGCSDVLWRLQLRCRELS